MLVSEVTLYNKDSNGKLRVWSISSKGNIITIEHGQLGGLMQIKEEEIEEGKQSRTIDEQVQLRMASRISKQRDKGYVNEILRADNTTNVLGMKKPMLAKLKRDVKNIDYSKAFIQNKYDGHRCLITKHAGKIIAYTRNGKIIKTLDHITEGLEERLPEGYVLDGELYCHGVPLQTITSWTKRKQENTLQLVYYIYDLMIDVTFETRLHEVYDIADGRPSIIIAGTPRVYNWDNVLTFYEESRKSGYEGSILRWGTGGYENKRSKHLVKIKEKVDDEFRVFDITRSKDGWAILHCETELGEFGVSAPGTMSEKKMILNNKYKYITIEYANLTNDGIPFHPVALRWKEDI